MYEYRPNTDKKTEKLVFSGLLVLAAIFYVGSMLPMMPMPALFQLIAFAILAVAIVVISKFMLCRYEYRVGINEANPQGELDFVITECVGKRRTVVCRIERSAVVSVTPVTKENKKALASKHKGKNVYRYVGELFADNCHLLHIKQEDTEFYLYILSDEGLKKAILNI